MIMLEINETMLLVLHITCVDSISSFSSEAKTADSGGNYCLCVSSECRIRSSFW